MSFGTAIAEGGGLGARGGAILGAFFGPEGVPIGAVIGGVGGGLVAGAGYLWVTNHMSNASSSAGTKSTSTTSTRTCSTCCPACKTVSGRTVAPGTLGYRHDLVPPSKPHHPYPGDHYNLYKANQSPYPACKCFWSYVRTDDASGGKPPPPGSIPIEPFAP